MGFHASDDEYLDEIKIYSRKEVAALKAENARLRAALEKCESWFWEYEANHLAKGTPDGDRKAATNARRAEHCAVALSGSG